MVCPNDPRPSMTRHSALAGSLEMRFLLSVGGHIMLRFRGLLFFEVV